MNKRNFTEMLDTIVETSLIKNIEPAKNDVAIMIGKFSPFTIGHLKIVETINLPLYIFVTGSNKNGGNREFLSQEDRISLIESVISDKVKVIPIHSANLLEIIDNLRENGKELKELYVGSDRVESFKKQINRYKDKINSKLEIIEIERKEDDVSASKVRESLEENNLVEFKRNMPRKLWNQFEPLKRKIKLYEAVYQNNMGLEELWKFMKVANNNEQKQMDDAIENNDWEKVKNLIKKVLGVYLK